MNIQIRIMSPARYRVVWDDENPDWGYKCRTQFPGFTGPDNPPAVNRFAFEPLPPAQRIGDYRVDISAWESPFKILNNDTTGRLFGYWTDPNLAQFNDKGFPFLAYLLFSGNEIRGERVGDWFRFVTLKPGDDDKVQGMTIQTHPHLVHRFTCVTWKVVNGVGFTLHINSTGTPKGDLFYHVVTKDGFGFIPWRHVKEI
jgi:hypothetical protein